MNAFSSPACSQARYRAGGNSGGDILRGFFLYGRGEACVIPLPA